MKSIKFKGRLVLAILLGGAFPMLMSCGSTSGYKQADKTGAGNAASTASTAR